MKDWTDAPSWSGTMIATTMDSERMSRSWEMIEPWICQNLSVVGDELKRHVWIKYPWMWERSPEARMCCSKSLLVLRTRASGANSPKSARPLSVTSQANRTVKGRPADDIEDKKCPLENA
jgi:hypothetical protein